jgi:hypothetical protein
MAGLLRDAGVWSQGRWRLLTCAAGLASSVNCATLGGRMAPPRAVRTFSTQVTLHGERLDLHLAAPAAPVSETLAVFATGDGGWFGTAVGMFHGIAAAGYRTVGFSARAFLRLERPAHAPLDPRRLAADYAAILRQARLALGAAPDTPAILTGWSRGAAFAAIAGTEPALGPRAAGVVAIGLAADENLQVDADADADGDDGPGTATTPARGFAPYDRLVQLGPVRCAVIQATHDDYLAAADARALLGPDSPTRRLYAVPATNHRFAGGHDEFDAALADALAWVDGVHLPRH